MLSLLPMFLPAPCLTQQPTGANSLANNVVLIARHAEKPEKGNMLTAQGEARARAYVSYFEPFREGTLTWKVDALFAGADSESSLRPRLTLEPLSNASGIPLNTTFGTKDPHPLLQYLQTTPHGMHPLICWRHGQIPALLEAFGASPKELLPNGVWPDEVFDWLIVLRFDSEGRLVGQMRLIESLKVSPLKVPSPLHTPGA